MYTKLGLGLQAWGETDPETIFYMFLKIFRPPVRRLRRSLRLRQRGRVDRPRQKGPRSEPATKRFSRASVGQALRVLRQEGREGPRFRSRRRRLPVQDVPGIEVRDELLRRLQRDPSTLFVRSQRQGRGVQG